MMNRTTRQPSGRRYAGDALPPAGLETDPNPKTDSGEPAVYQIRIQGHLNRRWTDWFEGLTITLEEDGETLLTGPVADQAALYGLLSKVRDLGPPLISVCRVDAGHADASGETYRHRPEKETRE
jgi:hypothetical protein